jgi:caffeoyl-CoA O-methyltransferase
MNDLIEKYCAQHTSDVPRVLNDLERATNLHTTQPHMLSGKLQGQFLVFLSKILAPKMVIDIGTFTGYSALCFAEGLAEGGVVHTIDIDEEKENIINEFIQKSSNHDKIKFHLGKAVDIIPTIKGDFDMVFIDADKESYSEYFNLVIDRVRSGGLIIADNILWKGKVLDDKKDKKTAIIDAFNKDVQENDKIENILLPLRDGLMIMRKK